MSLTQQFVAEVFEPLTEGNPKVFLENVAEDVEWTVLGTHPLAGTYQSKEAFQSATFGRLAKVIQGQMVLQIDDILVDGDTAVVQLSTRSTAVNGSAFDNDYCWICTFENKKISKVRAYLDSALVARVIEENESILTGMPVTAIPAFSTMPGH